MLEPAAYDGTVLADNSRKFCVLYSALESTVGATCPRWRMKPKTHLMQELCEMHTHNPSSNWLYRDEDFGGSMAAFARRRGGPARPAVVSACVLMKFRARHPLPLF